ncbi:S-adenosylmethionine:tRNA ribosyltransferase-isomerase [Fulvivirga sedimenti]|uniref:S-adenosylmethionine:tRNA ribosyltransferase-isomerase n=1 Tax=Fulvivirga sedimenti TaxID=2879465 RepID=A0A9X1HJN1_9BACT|nr:S-adenosylmethionine:tRNA ribosyltransferase-isomerase [Fulvivirga sedimenti]MCA6073290.1 S-adenosylmethionine:tRNA ribosyltransferase-isomerase [Fulvivirga sedimenti]
MNKAGKIQLSDYTYELPAHRIAEKPLPERDQSKLLIYQKGYISHHIFNTLSEQLPDSSSLFFNDTKVIPARIIFQRSTGALIEVFLLEPVLPSPDIATAMSCTVESTWKCLVGNFKKWKNDEILELSVPAATGTITVRASIHDRTGSLITLTWNAPIAFSELVELIGKIPLPPYIKREADPSDKDRYQTVYSHAAGAVAAPTAGLHFTPEVLNSLEDRGIKTDFLTLHVSAGTFMPIKEDDITKHQMHGEQIYVTRDNLLNIMASATLIAVGTTSMRTLESLYWYGVLLFTGRSDKFIIDQNTAYEFNEKDLPGRNEAIQAIIDHMDAEGRTSLAGRTEIFIYPGYTFRVCDGLITNFHLPGSTLILLVAAFIGDDWKKVYQEALDNKYRFLSYGDSSLLIP